MNSIKKIIVFSSLIILVIFLSYYFYKEIPLHIEKVKVDGNLTYINKDNLNKVISENIKEKGFFEGEISESGITEIWQPLDIRPQISATIDVANLDEGIAETSEKINSLDVKPIVEIRVKGKDIDFDLVETKIAKLRENTLYLGVKEIGETIQGHEILSEKPSIDEEISKLATKYLEDEELSDFATKELLPVLENKEVASATEIVIENYKQFRRSKDA